MASDEYVFASATLPAARPRSARPRRLLALHHGWRGDGTGRNRPVRGGALRLLHVLRRLLGLTERPLRDRVLVRTALSDAGIGGAAALGEDVGGRRAAARIAGQLRVRVDELG